MCSLHLKSNVIRVIGQHSKCLLSSHCQPQQHDSFLPEGSDDVNNYIVLVLNIYFTFIVKLIYTFTLTA